MLVWFLSDKKNGEDLSIAGRASAEEQRAEFAGERKDGEKMSKSSMEDVIEATRIINKLDKRGKLAILRDLQKQGLEPSEVVTATHVVTNRGDLIPVTYTEGGEK